MNDKYLNYTGLAKYTENLEAFIDSKLEGLVPTTRKVNAKTLTEDINLTAYDVNAVPTTRQINGHQLGFDLNLTASDLNAVPTTRTINGKPLTTDITLSASDIAGLTTPDLSGYVPTSRTINGKALTGDITLNASDVSAVPTSRTVNGKALSSNITLDLGIGKSMAGQSVKPTSDTTVTAGNGAEVFNDYRARTYSGESAYTGNVASGTYCHAEGSQATATGDYSHAEGKSTIASGVASHVEGSSTTSSGGSSHAEGAFTISEGSCSHAEGNTSHAIGAKSHAEGTSTTANGESSHAEGNRTTADAHFSHAEGSNTTASGDSSHAEGYNTKATKNYSHSEGIDTTASGVISHAEGDGTTASGDRSHAEGYQSIASGVNSHAEGGYCHAEGSYSHAEGGHSTASGNYSHVEGAYNNATSYEAHAEGNYTTASGSMSHSEGYRTTASNYASHASGKYNKNMVTGGLLSNQIGDAFVVGNGTGTASDSTNGTLSNALRLAYEGTLYLTKNYNSSGADYAEYFEWLDGNPQAEDRVGRFVTLEGDKIKLAKEGDYVLGVVSGQPCIIGNADEDWLGRWEHDDFNRFVKEYLVEKEVEVTPPEDVKDDPDALQHWLLSNELTERDGHYFKMEVEVVDYPTVSWRHKANPNYDASQPYVERKDRQEWDAVGMVGVLSVIDDGTCEVNGYAKVTNDGVATSASRREVNTDTWRVLDRVTPNVVKIVFSIK